eukprot:c12696_g1_i1.p1 GENE.c12696_g1_i1~~c12696_g1_i1.p1  ORF type:complete len:495 (-),score=87.80 c12696_g1_i1:400-1824(-)
MLWGAEQYVLGNFLLVQSYFDHLKILRALPQDIQNPDDFNVKIKEHDFLVRTKKADNVFEIEVDDGTIAEKFNNSINKLMARMRAFDMHTRTIPFFSTIAMMFIVRVATILAAMYSSDPVRMSFLVSLLQFVVAPYSFFASVTLLVAIAPPLFLGHYTVYGTLNALIPTALSVPFTINNTFIVLFMAFDLLLSLQCTFSTALGKSVWFGWQKTLTHFFFGLLNAKSYTLIILLLIRGQTFNLTPWIIDAALGISPRLTRFITSNLTMHWAILFYNQHRMAHLPRVYEHAHKFHHYLCDTNAFDAHLYGSGMPEEFICMWTEIFLGVTSGIHWLPTTLSYHTLLISFSNKVGHTRKLNDAGGVNHHADHHTVHSKNFSIYNCLMDMYFGTNHPNNEKFFFANYIVEKVVKKNEKNRDGIFFRFTRTDSALGFQEMQDQYYSPGFINMVNSAVELLQPVIALATGRKASGGTGSKK